MKRRSRAFVVGMTAVLATVLCGSTASAAPAPGAPGLGDSYYPLDGNGGYDALHYDIRLSYQPATDQLSGTTTILAKATQDLSKFNLDFLLKVSSIRVNNVPATSVTTGGELTVTPKSTIKKGDNLTIVVAYSDKPEPYRLYGFPGWTKTPTGALGINEPQIAPWWYPSNDHPRDKATFDVSIAVPNGVEAMSNGTLLRVQPQPAGMTRWSWRSTQPQAPYLTELAIGQYEVRRSTTPDGKPFITAYGDDLGANADAARASVERTPEIIEFEEQNFGPFPFEAEGGVVDTSLGFALENQTRPVYDAGFWNAGSNTSVVAHENAHQWFGDSVSVHDWSAIWLNEGFATYAEYLWSEHEGEGTAAEVAQFTYDSIAADDPFWQVLPGNPGEDKQFDDAVYDRGGMTLQALRTAVGDTAFFKTLKTWVRQHKNSTATIPQFIALAEKISGKQLDELFQTWLFTAGKPAVGPNGTSTAAAKSATAKPKSFDVIQRTHKLLAAER